MARLLLDHGVDPSIKRNDLWSPLHLATRKSTLSSSNEWECRDRTSHDRPRSGCAYCGQQRLSCCFGGVLMSTCSTRPVEVQPSWHRRMARLRLRSSFPSTKRMQILEHCLRSTKLDRVEYGAHDDDGKDEAKVSLHAAEEGDSDFVKSLLKRGVDSINARDASNQTPLDIAAAKGSVNVVRLLIKREAEVDPCDKWGWTRLYSPSQSGHLEVSRPLPDHGANVNARQRGYWTPAHISAANGYCTSRS
jgi:Ankyrin repeats (3 copies)